jgi:hypothetical protein
MKQSAIRFPNLQPVNLEPAGIPTFKPSNGSITITNYDYDHDYDDDYE